MTFRFKIMRMNPVFWNCGSHESRILLIPVFRSGLRIIFSNPSHHFIQIRFHSFLAMKVCSWRNKASHFIPEKVLTVNICTRCFTTAGWRTLIAVSRFFFAASTSTKDFSLKLRSLVSGTWVQLRRCTTQSAHARASFVEVKTLFKTVWFGLVFYD